MAGRKPRLDQSPFSKVLKSIMQERGLKLADVAKMAGVSVSVVSGWSSGRTPSDLVKILALSESLSVPMAYLLTGQYQKHSKNTAPTMAEVLTEAEKFEGIFKISVQRLLPINGIESSTRRTKNRDSGG